jgi:hypothetical protein
MTKNNLQIGEAANDGSIYAGTFNEYKVFAAPSSLLDLTNSNPPPLTLTFNDAAKVVQKLNETKYLGHDDWKMPELEIVKAIHFGFSSHPLRLVKA